MYLAILGNVFFVCSEKKIANGYLFYFQVEISDQERAVGVHDHADFKNEALLWL